MHWVGLEVSNWMKKMSCQRSATKQIFKKYVSFHFPFNIRSLYTPTQSQVKVTTSNFIHWKKFGGGRADTNGLEYLFSITPHESQFSLWSWLKSMKSWVSIYDQQWFLIWYVVQGLYRRCLFYPFRQLVKWMRTHFTDEKANESRFFYASFVP